MRIAVEAWSPEYGGELNLRAPEEASTESVEADVEDRPWVPISPDAPGELSGRPIVFVDGTRRIDARLFLSHDGGRPIQGVAGSVGVGAVVCDPAPAGVDGRRGGRWWAAKAARVADARVERYLAAGAGVEANLPAGPGLAFKSLPVAGRELDKIVDAVHGAMRQAEAVMAQRFASEDGLVFVDGPLAVMDPGPQPIVGFIKAHHRRYLDAERERVVGELGCGQRSPLFSFGEFRPRYSWYVRLCRPSHDSHGWHGIVRCEAPAAIPLESVVKLADASAGILPAFASAAHWDPRAPQNLVPVAGLERRLRHLLGERELILRMIRSAARRISVGGDAA